MIWGSNPNDLIGLTQGHKTKGYEQTTVSKQCGTCGKIWKKRLRPEDPQSTEEVSVGEREHHNVQVSTLVRRRRGQLLRWRCQGHKRWRLYCKPLQGHQGAAGAKAQWDTQLLARRHRPAPEADLQRRWKTAGVGRVQNPNSQSPWVRSAVWHDRAAAKASQRGLL